MKTSRKVFWTVLLTGLSSAASACDLPPLAAVPDPSELGEEQRQAVRQEVSAYIEAMKVYTACVQAEIAAGGDDAPTYTAVLVNRNKAAVAEAYAVLEAFGPYAPLPANPGSEAALRRLIEEYARGEPNYDSMTPKAARVARRTERIGGGLFPIEKIIPFEKLESVTFLSTNARGADVYLVKLGPGGMLWEIELTSDGKISHSLMQVCRKHGQWVDPLPSCLPPGYLSPDRARELSSGNAGE